MEAIASRLEAIAIRWRPSLVGGGHGLKVPFAAISSMTALSTTAPYVRAVRRGLPRRQGCGLVDACRRDARGVGGDP